MVALLTEGYLAQGNHLTGIFILQKIGTFWTRTSTVENNKKYGIFLDKIRCLPYSFFFEPFIRLSVSFKKSRGGSNEMS